MKVGVLTSSRADYSIYLPLLKALKLDSFFDLKIIAFGTHLSMAHGYTVDSIVKDGFEIAHRIDSMPTDDSPRGISEAIGKTTTAFAELWATDQFDMVFCLGDRYEMFAACAASVPFGVTLAHIHGGETTEGAIDEAFRHSITHMAKYHFTAAEQYRRRVVELKGKDNKVFNVGSLSIDNLRSQQLLSLAEFKERFDIDLSKPTILITFHPETVSFSKNGVFADELVSALREIQGYQMVITMPNADTMGNLVRTKLKEFIAGSNVAIGVESFGTIGYLSCMKHCSFMLGNTSSGFIEAAWFPKYVINLGERQRGRIITPNIANCAIGRNEIANAVNAFPKVRLPEHIGIYGDGHAAETIVSILKDKN
jgi:GDP/UDP-N,N'-diacetylbacillosamine 2-epimerase (hydrolysing)